VNKLVCAALLGLALTACGTQDGPAGGAESAPASPAPVESPDPTAITIPKLGVHSELIRLGLTLDGELDVPPVDQPEVAGWYAGENTDEPGDEYDPGEGGPAIIAGHVDGIGPDGHKGHPGVFARLDELAPGDEIQVQREDGVTLTFVVYRVEQVAKDSFPTQEVYGPTTEPELRLITCGGAFDRAAGHYVANEVVWARQA
jgi:hypothetical protein